MSRNDQPAQGVLELHPKGYGFLRNPARHYAAQQSDPYVAGPLIHKFRLREGLLVAGPTEPNKKGAGPRLARVEQIEGAAPDQYAPRNFDDLTPIDPHEQIILETGRAPLTTTIQVNGRTMHRVSIAGFAGQADAARLCGAIRSQGGACFVRTNAGDASIRWAARYAPNARRQRDV